MSTPWSLLVGYFVFRQVDADEGSPLTPSKVETAIFPRIWMSFCQPLSR